ncbi:hypothetical protein BDP27DRAFT_1367575 [Rhodocollybia butyracea]|uniref:Uncharacterized protein n=1 Tax=Rhodocollybia butyracea TaxID=206335 RepID=A0A9P5PKY7_9AGAR|nr:hypothetical protein BDP27DRAFT_1367575 [Rhodocollybia butyracea]
MSDSRLVLSRKIHSLPIGEDAYVRAVRKPLTKLKQEENYKQQIQLISDGGEAKVEGVDRVMTWNKGDVDSHIAFLKRAQKPVTEEGKRKSIVAERTTNRSDSALCNDQNQNQEEEENTEMVGRGPWTLTLISLVILSRLLAILYAYMY